MSHRRLLCGLVSATSVMEWGQVMVFLYWLVVSGWVLVWEMGGLYLGVECALFLCKILWCRTVGKGVEFVTLIILWEG